MASGRSQLSAPSSFEGNPILIYGDGETVRDYIFMRDVVDALLSAGRSSAASRIPNVATGEGRSLNTVAGSVGRYVDRPLTVNYEAPSFAFLDEFEDLEPIYARADICFLSSRLHPLPSIAIDSAIRGIPVICFDQASGIAKILKKSREARDLVVPYLDAEGAAQLIFELTNHEQACLCADYWRDSIP